MKYHIYTCGLDNKVISLFHFFDGENYEYRVEMESITCYKILSVPICESKYTIIF